jgi:two-component system response regulator
MFSRPDWSSAVNMGSPAEILVVENNDSQRECIVASIEAAVRDASVACVSGTEDAMAFLFGSSRSEPPKLLLLDLDLGDCNGMEVLARIRAGDDRSALTHIPIVIFSDSQNEESISEGYRLGANSYVIKPLDFLEFQRVVENVAFYWLSRNQTASG